MSITVQRDATIYSLIIFLQTTLHVSDDSLIHHQEHIQNVLQHPALVESYLLLSADVEETRFLHVSRNIIKLYTVPSRTIIDIDHNHVAQFIKTN